MAYFMVVSVVYGIFAFDITFPQVISIGAAAALGLILDYLLHTVQKTGRKHFPISGFISALIVVVLLPPGVSFVALLVSVFAAIASKHFLIYKHMHVFNPAAVGALVAVFAFDLSLSWWPDTFIWLVIPLGLWIAWRVKKLLQAAAFFFFYLLLFVVGGGLPAIDINIFYFIPWFFGLFMLVEPMTSPAGKKREIIFGAAVAVLIWIFGFLPFFALAPLILALLVGNFLKRILMKI